MPAGAIGGALGLVVDLVVNARVFPGGGFDLFFNRILPAAVGQAAAGVLYGALTGVVFAMIVVRLARRSAA